MKMLNLFTRKELQSVPDEQLKDKERDKPTQYIKYPQQLLRVTQTIEKWRTGNKQAESILSPNRRNLLMTYQDVVLDNHLSGLMQARKNKILGKNFMIVDAAGEVNEEKTKMFQASWFRKFISLALDTPYYGFTLIQLGDVEGNKFADCELVRREYVTPEFGIVSQTPGSIIGKSYLEAPWNMWCIPIGERRDLGLLLKASPLVIWKKNALGAWAEYAEIFGSPMRIGKTDTRDAATRKNMIDMFVNGGTSPWMVVDKNDEIEFAQVTRTDAFNIYKELINTANSELSKLILGQTGTTDEKTHVGSAKVHEDVADDFARNDEAMLMQVLKDKLFPVMAFHGMGMTDNDFPKFSDSEKLDADQKIKIDEVLMRGQFRPTKEYIEKEYGTPGDYQATPSPTFGASTAAKLKNLYE